MNTSHKSVRLDSWSHSIQQANIISPEKNYLPVLWDNSNPQPKLLNIHFFVTRVTPPFPPNFRTACMIYVTTHGDNQQWKTEKRYWSKKQVLRHINQASDRNRTNIRRPKVTGIEYSTVAPFINKPITYLQHMNKSARKTKIIFHPNDFLFATYLIWNSINRLLFYSPQCELYPKTYFLVIHGETTKYRGMLGDMVSITWPKTTNMRLS